MLMNLHTICYEAALGNLQYKPTYLFTYLFRTVMLRRWQPAYMLPWRCLLLHPNWHHPSSLCAARHQSRWCILRRCATFVTAVDSRLEYCDLQWHVCVPAWQCTSSLCDNTNWTWPLRAVCMTWAMDPGYCLASLITMVQIETQTSSRICASSPGNELSRELTSLITKTRINCHLFLYFCNFQWLLPRN